MESLENKSTDQQATRSNLSDWIGPGTITNQTPNEAVRIGQDQVIPDTTSVAERLYELLPGLGVGQYLSVPGASAVNLWNLMSLFQHAYPLEQMATLYTGFTYDDVEITLTLSDPKGLAGGIYVGYFPWRNWFGGSLSSAATGFNGNLMQNQHLLLSPECQLMPLTSAQDVKFTIPWQFNVPWISFTDQYMFNTSSTTATPIVGSPIIWMMPLSTTYVTSVHSPAKFRGFVKFHGLRFVGPINPDVDARSSLRKATSDMYPQSGAAVAAGAAGASILVDKILDAGSEILETVTGIGGGDDLDGSNSAGTYQNPDAVQLAFVGDSTSTGAPPTTPIFTNWIQNSAMRHAVLSYLKRPQLIQIMTDGQTATYLANPTFPVGKDTQTLSGSNQTCTYFRWFAQAASFWRGTIKFHFIILGHSMIQMDYHLTILYPPDFPDTVGYVPTDSSNVLTGTFSGVKHIVVPMPFLWRGDHVPIVDGIGNFDETNLENIVQLVSPSAVQFTCSVINTMLDTIPSIPIHVFMSAGDDFRFYQPFAVGLNNVDNLSREQLVALQSELQPQINLPPVDQTFQTRACVCEATNTLPEMTNVEDWMDIWSRSLPYGAYDTSDEPVPAFDYGSDSPAWWPLPRDSASYTLDVNNSWYCTNDYISLFSTMFMYFRGSIASKVCCAPNADVTYKYIALNATNWRQEAHSPFTYADALLPPQCNFGNGTVCTPLAEQPILDITLPFRSPFIWDFVIQQDPYNCSLMDSWVHSSANKTFVDVLNNITLQDSDGNLNDAMFRKIGSDFGLAVEALLPPPCLWASRGFDWEFDSLSSDTWKVMTKKHDNRFKPKPNDGVEKQLKEAYFTKLREAGLQEPENSTRTTTSSQSFPTRRRRKNATQVSK